MSPDLKDSYITFLVSHTANFFAFLEKIHYNIYRKTEHIQRYELINIQKQLIHPKDKIILQKEKLKYFKSQLNQNFDQKLHYLKKVSQDSSTKLTFSLPS